MIEGIDLDGKRDFDRVLGDGDRKNTGIDNMYLMKKNAGASKKPRLYVSCGTADYLYPIHQRFVPALKENGWDVTSYEEPDAIHEWGFWDRQIKAFIDFMYEGEK